MPTRREHGRLLDRTPAGVTLGWGSGHGILTSSSAQHLLLLQQASSSCIDISRQQRAYKLYLASKRVSIPTKIGDDMKLWGEIRFRGIETRKEDHRRAYAIDACRIIHSFAFRRLEGKLQIINHDQSDFHRNRLTHSLEVASISQHIFNNVFDRYSNDEEYSEFLEEQREADITSLLSAIGLAHDLGHPPFGHAGEIALNYMMNYEQENPDDRGFEGNAQTLRLLTLFEKESNDKTEEFNLCKRTLLGIVKYPIKYSKAQNNPSIEIPPKKNRLIKHSEWHPPKSVYDKNYEAIKARLLSDVISEDRDKFFEDKEKYSKDSANKFKSKYKTFDCSIMELADDIAYSIHDLEDAIFFKRIDRDAFSDEIKKIGDDFLKGEGEFNKLLNQLFSEKVTESKGAIGKLVHQAIIRIKLKKGNEFKEDILKYYVKFDNETAKFIEALKEVVKKHLIETPEVQCVVHGGMITIMQIFEALKSNDSLLPKYVKNSQHKNRAICDYLAGMTDSYATKLHERIYGSRIINMLDWH